MNRILKIDRDCSFSTYIKEDELFLNDINQPLNHFGQIESILQNIKIEKKYNST